MKKSLALVVAMCMVLSFIPAFSVSAGETRGDTTCVIATENFEGSEYTLGESVVGIGPWTAEGGDTSQSTATVVTDPNNAGNKLLKITAPANGNPPLFTYNFTDRPEQGKLHIKYKLFITPEQRGYPDLIGQLNAFEADGTVRPAFTLTFNGNNMWHYDAYTERLYDGLETKIRCDFPVSAKSWFDFEQVIDFTDNSYILHYSGVDANNQPVQGTLGTTDDNSVYGPRYLYEEIGDAQYKVGEYCGISSIGFRPVQIDTDSVLYVDDIEVYREVKEGAEGEPELPELPANTRLIAAENFSESEYPLGGSVVGIGPWTAVGGDATQSTATVVLDPNNLGNRVLKITAPANGNPPMFNFNFTDRPEQGKLHIKYKVFVTPEQRGYPDLIGQLNAFEADGTVRPAFTLTFNGNNMWHYDAYTERLYDGLETKIRCDFPVSAKGWFDFEQVIDFTDNSYILHYSGVDANNQPVQGTLGTDNSVYGPFYLYEEIGDAQYKAGEYYGISSIGFRPVQIDTDSVLYVDDIQVYREVKEGAEVEPELPELPDDAYLIAAETFSGSEYTIGGSVVGKNLWTAVGGDASQSTATVVLDPNNTGNKILKITAPANGNPPMFTYNFNDKIGYGKLHIKYKVFITPEQRGYPDMIGQLNAYKADSTVKPAFALTFNGNNMWHYDAYTERLYDGLKTKIRCGLPVSAKGWFDFEQVIDFTDNSYIINYSGVDENNQPVQGTLGTTEDNSDYGPRYLYEETGNGEYQKGEYLGVSSIAFRPVQVDAESALYVDDIQVYREVDETAESGNAFPGLPSQYGPINDGTTVQRFEQRVDELPDEVPVMSARVPEGATTFYVSPDENGNDLNWGTFDEPFRTLERALEFVKALPQEQKQQGIVIYLRGGTYSINNTITLNSEHSGTEDAPLFISAYQNEKVEFTTGVKLDGSQFAPISDDTQKARLYENARDKVLVANLPAMGIYEYGSINFSPDIEAMQPSLYWDQETLTLARWPNRTNTKVGPVIDQGPRGCDPYLEPDDGRGFTFKFVDDRPLNWENTGDLGMDGGFYYDWHTPKVEIRTIDKVNRTINSIQPSQYGVREGGEYFYFNVFEELDASGEWYLDRSTGNLYVYPIADMADADLYFTAKPMDVFQVQGASHVVFNGITVKCSGGTAYRVQSGTDIVIQNGTMSQLAGSAARFDGCKLSGVLNSYVYNTGAESIVIAGTMEEAANLTPSRNFVQNSFIGKQDDGSRCCGVRTTNKTVGAVISHNLFQNFAYAAITSDGDENIIEYNEIVGSPRVASDIGAIYTGNMLTRGQHYRYNYIHDNSMYNTSHDFTCAIYFDVCGSDSYAYGNVIHNVPQATFSHGGKDLVVFNNIIAGAWDRSNASYFKDSLNYYGDWNPTWSREVWREWGSFLEQACRGEIDPYSPMWANRYPNLKTYMDKLQIHLVSREQPGYVRDSIEEDLRTPGEHYIGNNLSYQHAGLNMSEIGQSVAFGLDTNRVTDQDPGFVDYENDNFALKEDAPVFDWIPGFEAPPFEKMGLLPEGRWSDLHVGNTTLVSPANRSIGQSQQVYFDWTAAEYANRYTLVVAEDPDFQTVVASEIVEISSAELTLPKRGQTYYWKVIPTSLAKAVDGKTSESQVYSFTTEGFGLASYTNNEQTLNVNFTSKISSGVTNEQLTSAVTLTSGTTVLTASSAVISEDRMSATITFPEAVYGTVYTLKIGESVTDEAQQTFTDARVQFSGVDPLKISPTSTATKSGNVITVTPVLENVETIENGAVLLVGVYDSTTNQLLGWDLVPLSNASTSIEPIPISGITNENAEVRLFVWTSTSKMAPLCTNVTVTVVPQ